MYTAYTKIDFDISRAVSNIGLPSMRL